MAEYLVTLGAHFVFVFASMALFFAPFVGLFWWRHRIAVKEAKPHFNYFMERFFLSKESNYLVLCWAAAEAVVWFIIPEFLLLLMVFMKIRRKRELIVYDVIGTVIGTVIAYMWNASEQVLLSFPYVFQGMIDHVHAWYEQLGVWGLIYQPFSGVPYKVFTHLAPEYYLPVLGFLVVAIVVRMSRYLVVYEISRRLYPFLHKYVRRHYLVLFVGAILIFTMMLMRVSDIYR